MGYPKVPFLILPITRHELPGWGRLYSLLGVGDIERLHEWREAPQRTIRGKWHGYLMDLDLSNWSERLTYFLGRYYELETQLALRELLQAGDTLVDVGANLGMIALLAAFRVGKEGRVHCFEPNPKCIERLRKTITKNRLEDVVTVHEVAAGAKSEFLPLHLASDHTGTGTLVRISENNEQIITDTFDVPVRRLDDELTNLPSQRTIMKIDVEGFELEALRGAERLISCTRPLVIMECIERHLEGAGTSRREIANHLHKRGYRGYWMSTQRQKLTHELRLAPISARNISTPSQNTVWVHLDDDRLTKINRFVGSSTA